MRSRSFNFFKKSGSPARRVTPGPGLDRLKSKKSTCVPLKTLKLKVLWEEGTKLISIAKLHLEVLRAVKPKKCSPAGCGGRNGLASLAKRRPHVADLLRSHTDPLNETSWLRPCQGVVKI